MNIYQSFQFFLNEKEFNTTGTEYYLVSTMRMNNLTENGKIICEASNEYGSSQSEAELFINDLDDEFLVQSHNETIVTNYPAIIECGAALFNYSEVNWYKNDVQVDAINSEYLLLLVFITRCQ